MGTGGAAPGADRPLLGGSSTDGLAPGTARTSVTTVPIESPTSFGPAGSGPAAPAAATPARAPLEPTRLGGASVLEPALGPRGTTTGAGVPFAPIGGVGGAPPGEQRLSRASYLVEDDPDALAGELPRVAPPVIGA